MAYADRKAERVSELKRLRANILLKADDGLTDREIADGLEAGRVGDHRMIETAKGAPRARDRSGGNALAHRE
jgi:hypothetical protein